MMYLFALRPIRMRWCTKIILTFVCASGPSVVVACDYSHRFPKNGTPAIGIDVPGRHCLESSAEEAALFYAGKRTVDFGPFVGLFSANVDLNFHNHSVVSDHRGRQGVRAVGGQYVNDQGERMLAAYNLRIHDGTINVGFDGIRLPRSWDINSMSLKRYHHYKPRYVDTSVQIENMRISAGMISTLIDGGKTIIRNCTIETTMHTAILLFGPAALIENNTIIVRNAMPNIRNDKEMGQGSIADNPWSPQSAPIRLRDAAGAIVRNNKIYIVDGKLPSGPAKSETRQAITLENSPEVTIEGNQIFAAAELPLWQAYDGQDLESDMFNAQAPNEPKPARIHTTVTERDNQTQFGKRFGFGPETLPKVGR